jgi:hypothetical protein
LGVVAGEFGGNSIGIIQLPDTSGSGTPVIVDSVLAVLPATPDGAPFANGFDPHTTTAYTSPKRSKSLWRGGSLGDGYSKLSRGHRFKGRAGSTQNRRSYNLFDR